MARMASSAASRQIPSYKAQSRARMRFDWRGLAMMGGGIAAITLVAFAGGYALRNAPGGLPVVEASNLPVRIKPADGGGDATIGTDEVAQPGTGEGLAPQTEMPNLHALNEIRQKPPGPKPDDGASLQIKQRFAVLSDHIPSLIVSADAASVSKAPLVAPPVAASTVMTTGGVAVQLGALNSEAAAQAAWDSDEAQMPDLLANRAHLLTPMTIGNRQMWRLRVGGFTDLADAANFCAKLRTRGTACTVAAF